MVKETVDLYVSVTGITTVTNGLYFLLSWESPPYLNYYRWWDDFNDVCVFLRPRGREERRLLATAILLNLPKSLNLLQLSLTFIDNWIQKENYNNSTTSESCPAWNPYQRSTSQHFSTAHQKSWLFNTLQKTLSQDSTLTYAPTNLLNDAVLLYW